MLRASRIVGRRIRERTSSRSNVVNTSHSVATMSRSAPRHASYGLPHWITPLSDTVPAGSYARISAPAAISREAMSRAGDIRVSSVSALNVTPQSVIRAPSRSPPASRVALSTIHRRCDSFASIDARTSVNGRSTSSAIAASAAVSFGKHEPPHPGPGCRKRSPMRLSRPTDPRTSRTSAPRSSQSSATLFAKLIFIARKPFDAYLTSSALAAFITTTSASTPAYRLATRCAACGSSDPITIRSGLRKS